MNIFNTTTFVKTKIISILSTLISNIIYLLYNYYYVISSKLLTIIIIIIIIIKQLFTTTSTNIKILSSIICFYDHN